MLNSGADDTLLVMTAELMTALPMTLRVDRFAERHPRSGHQSQIVIATRCVVIQQLFHHKTTNSVRLQRRAIPDKGHCLCQ